MSRLLRLLPSRPDRFHRVSLRKDQKVTIETLLQQHTSMLGVIESARIMTKARSICKVEFAPFVMVASFLHYYQQALPK